MAASRPINRADATIPTARGSPPPPIIMVSDIWVAGFPSTYGGADTELDHLIDLFRRYGVGVHLVPMFGADEAMSRSVLERGCTIHEYRDDVFAGQTVVSFCNGHFLSSLPQITRAGRPDRVIWFNSMTWTFADEMVAHGHGWIDYFGFVSEYQKQLLVPQLEAVAPVPTFAYKPFFNSARVAWQYRSWDDSYRIGRISRDDGNRFAPDTWRIFERVLVPAGLNKKVYVLGFGPNAERKIGSAPPALDWRTWAANEIPASDFYRTIDTMIHKTGGSRESYCRVLVEAYAHGVVPIVERDYAFPELVVHGETGFMTSDSDEMSYYASLLAHNPDEHRRIARNGRHHLDTTLADPDSCFAGWHELLS
jgi:glycosyltransferase involved in cell wall biosynthesis